MLSSTLTSVSVMECTVDGVDDPGNGGGFDEGAVWLGSEEDLFMLDVSGVTLLGLPGVSEETFISDITRRDMPGVSFALV